MKSAISMVHPQRGIQINSSMVERIAQALSVARRRLARSSICA